MTECEIITFIQKGLELAIKIAEQAGVHSDKNYEQKARNWLENKLSEAAAQEVSEMKRGRGENE